MNVHIEVVVFCIFFALFNSSTASDAANDCFINSDEGEGFLFAITIRAPK